MRCELLYEIKKLYEKIEENTFKTNFNDTPSITFKKHDLFFTKSLLSRMHKLTYNTEDLLIYSSHKLCEEKDYLTPLRAKLDEKKLREIIEKEKLENTFYEFKLKNHLEYRFNSPVCLFFGNSRSYKVGLFCGTTNNKEKLFANKELGVTFTRDLADSILSISFGSHADITPRKFFYKEMDKFNLLNPEKRINYQRLDKSFLSLNLEYYALFDLFKNERGIFGLKSKIFVNNTPSDARKLVFSCFLSRRVKDLLDFVLKVKVRRLGCPKLSGDQLNYFTSLEEFRNISDTTQDPLNSIELKSITNYKLNDNIDVYGNINVFDNQPPKAGIGFKYYKRDENKNNNFSMLNLYMDSSFACKFDINIPISKNIEFVAGLKTQGSYPHPYFNVAYNCENEL